MLPPATAILRVTGFDTPFPYTLEHVYMPDPKRTLAAVETSIINNTMLIQIALLAWLFLGEGLGLREIVGLALAALGTLILWLGWFGFNGGSELKVSDVGEANAVALVFVNTNMAAAGGLVAALLLARAWFGKADLTMALNGALAGLVAITADPLSPVPIGATLIGVVGGQVGAFARVDAQVGQKEPVGLGEGLVLGGVPRVADQLPGAFPHGPMGAAHGAA